MVKVEKSSPRKKSTDKTASSSPVKKSPNKKGSPVKIEKSSPQKKPRPEPAIAYSKGTIRSIIQRANPEMQIAANVPAMIATAALQFTVHLAQSSLEASIRREPGIDALPPKELAIEYADVARAVQGDPRLEPLHDNVPHQIQAQEALVKRAELMAKLAAEYDE